MQEGEKPETSILGFTTTAAVEEGSDSDERVTREEVPGEACDHSRSGEAKSNEPTKWIMQQ